MGYGRGGIVPAAKGRDSALRPPVERAPRPGSLEQARVTLQEAPGILDMRQSVSGVNMDEELANMIKYQHGYQAAARFVTTVNSMLDILMRLGA